MGHLGTLRLHTFLLLTALPLGATACAEEQEVLLVLDSIPFDADCSADPDTDERLGMGHYDVSLGTEYLRYLTLLNNQRSRPPSETNSGVEDGEIQMLDAEVTLRSPEDPELLRGIETHFTQPLNRDSVMPGEQRAELVVLPSTFAESLAGRLGPTERATLEVDVVFHASRSGNHRGRAGLLESRTYSFPITVCDGCCPFLGACGTAQDLTCGP